MEVTTEPVKKKARTAFQLAAVRNGLKGRTLVNLVRKVESKAKLLVLEEVAQSQRQKRPQHLETVRLS